MLAEARTSQGVAGLTMARDGKTLLTSTPNFAEAAAGGRCFTVANAAGVTSQAGLSATTPVLTLANPAGSGVTGKLWYACATVTVAFATAGVIWVAGGTSTIEAAVTGTLHTNVRNLKLGSFGVVGGAQGNRIQALLAATLPSIPVPLDILATGLTGAITTTPYINVMEKWYNGAILIQPGCNISIQTGVASGANGLFCGYFWEEVDLIN